MATKRKQKELEKVLCGDCVFWGESRIQEDDIRNGLCHEGPMLPQRKATDWCSRGKRV